MAYIPPECNDIPFVFSDSGYIPPSCDNILFNFRPEARLSNLKAFVNVISPFDYIKDTYTYTKSCPTHIIGYNNSYQILKELCTYGGIRGMSASIASMAPPVSSIDISAHIKGFATEPLEANISSHGPIELKSSIKSVVKGYYNIDSRITGLTFSALTSSFTGTHYPSELMGTVFTKQRLHSSIKASIHSFATANLGANLNIVKYESLPAVMSIISPEKLRSSINVIEIRDITASIFGWQFSNLAAQIKRIYDYGIKGRINAVTDTNKRLKAMAKGFANEDTFITATMQSYHISSLSANLLSFYFRNIKALISPVAPVRLLANIHSWDNYSLTAGIISNEYLWKLTANIRVSGEVRNLPANISSIYGRSYKGLIANIHTWKTNAISGFISSLPAPILIGIINPVGNCSRLIGTITPKTIRLTTIIDVATMSSRVLTGIVNSLCFSTGYKTISAVIAVKYKLDLAAYIKPIIPSYVPSDLSATIGYSNYISVEDKFRLNINISDGYFTVIDSYRLMINFLKGGSMLKAGVNGVLRSSSLSSSIMCKEIQAYNFDHPIKSKETVVHRSYDGNAIDYESVEIAFNSIVNDYFYSSSGNELWKNNRLEKWAIDIKSILLENPLLRPKRVLNRATILRNLRNFNTIDDAIKYAINYVTDRPTSSLASIIKPVGYYTSLQSSIAPKLPVVGSSNLTASITADDDSIIISVGDTIIIV